MYLVLDGNIAAATPLNIQHIKACCLCQRRWLHGGLTAAWLAVATLHKPWESLAHDLSWLPPWVTQLQPGQGAGSEDDTAEHRGTDASEHRLLQHPEARSLGSLVPGRSHGDRARDGFSLIPAWPPQRGFTSSCSQPSPALPSAAVPQPQVPALRAGRAVFSQQEMHLVGSLFAHESLWGQRECSDHAWPCSEGSGARSLLCLHHALCAGLAPGPGELCSSHQPFAGFPNKRVVSCWLSCFRRTTCEHPKGTKTLLEILHCLPS